MFIPSEKTLSMEIIQYKNYGCRMSSFSEDESVRTSKSYWCFFMLNNKRVINIHHIGNWSEDGLPLGWDIYSNYDMCYEFGEDFTVYWDRHWNYTKAHHMLGHTSEEEHNLVCEYYMMYIEPHKDVETDIVFL